MFDYYTLFQNTEFLLEDKRVLILNETAFGHLQVNNTKVLLTLGFQ